MVYLKLKETCFYNRLVEIQFTNVFIAVKNIIFVMYGLIISEDNTINMSLDIIKSERDKNMFEYDVFLNCFESQTIMMIFY